MWKFSCLLILLAATSTAVLGANTGDSEVKDVIQKFQQALERHDIEAIGAIVSEDVVVLENGRRNDGWKDFRDNHLLPEFKEPAEPSTWQFVKVVASSEMAWGYTKQTIDATGKDGKHAGLMVWSVYVLQKTGSSWKVVLLDWSVRQVGAAA